MVSQKELKWVLIFASVVIIITTLPYLLGFAFQGKEWVFTGFVFGVEDGNSYIAKMLSGANGAFLFKTPYSTLDQSGFLAFVPYILLGKLTSLPGQHEQLVAIFQLYRWAGIIFLSIVSYYFISTFISQVYIRKFALVISMVGGGLGWTSLLYGTEMPLELYSPETFGFLSVFGIPHLLFSKALLLLGLYGFINWKKRLRSMALVAIIWLIMGFFQPLTIVIGWLVLAAYLALWECANLLRKEPLFTREWIKNFLYYAGLVVITSPWVIYNYVSFQTDPYLKGWYGQNIILSPHIFSYLISFGALIPLAVWGVFRIVKKRDQKAYLLAAWIMIFLLLVYIPSNVQRRMAEGFWTAFVILCWLPFADKNITSRWLTMLVGISLMVSSLILITGSVLVTTHPSSPVFVPASEIEMFNFLRDQANPGDVVLASYETSNPLPAWTGLRVVMGHGPESIHLTQIRKEVNDFYFSDNERAQKIFLKDMGIQYVVNGPLEKNLDPVHLSDLDVLQNIYEKGGTTIYRVMDQ